MIEEIIYDAPVTSALHWETNEPSPCIEFMGTEWFLDEFMRESSIVECHSFEAFLNTGFNASIRILQTGQLTFNIALIQNTF